MTTFFTQGLGSQHSAAPLGHWLRRRGYTVHNLDGMTRHEITAFVQGGHDGPLVLIATDHPLFTVGNFAKHVPESVPYYMSIADLSALRDWDVVVYMEHDGVDEFQNRELPIGADYDLIALDRPRERPALRRLSALTRRPHPLMPQVPLPDAAWLFMPSFITVLRTDIDAWRRTFPFLSRDDGVVKLPHDGSVEEVEAAMAAAGIRVIPSTTRVEELLGDFDGLVITADTSGVIADCAEFGATAVVWLNADPKVQRATAARFGAHTAASVDELEALLASPPSRRRRRRRLLRTEWFLVRIGLALARRRLREWTARRRAARSLARRTADIRPDTVTNLRAALALVASGTGVQQVITMVDGMPLTMEASEFTRMLAVPRRMPRLLSSVVVVPTTFAVEDWRDLRSVAREFALVHIHREHIEHLFGRGFFHAEPVDEGASWWNGLADDTGEIVIVNRSRETVTADVRLTVSSPAGRVAEGVEIRMPGLPVQRLVDLAQSQTVTGSFPVPPGTSIIEIQVHGGLRGDVGDPNAAVVLRVDEASLTTDHPCPHEHRPDVRTRQIWHHAGYECVARLDEHGQLVEGSIAGTNEGHPYFQPGASPSQAPWVEDACGSWYLLAAASPGVVGPMVADALRDPAEGRLAGLT